MERTEAELLGLIKFAVKKHLRVIVNVSPADNYSEDPSKRIKVKLLWDDEEFDADSDVG